MNKTVLQFIIERELINLPKAECDVIVSPKVTRNKYSHSTKVRCINNGKEFTSLAKAAEYAGLYSPSSLSKHLSGTQYIKGVGKHPETKELLRWEIIREDN